MRKRRKQQNKRSSIIMFTSFLIATQFLNPISTFAASGPGITSAQGSATKELINDIPESLNDHNLQYSEIADMVHYKNSTVLQISESIADSLNDYVNMKTEMEAEREWSKWQKNDAKKSNDIENLIYYSTQEAIYNAGVKGYRKAINSIDSKSTYASQKKVERQLTIAIQSLYQSYDSLIDMETLLSESEHVYNKQLKIMKQKKSLGLSITSDILSSESQLASIQSSKLSVNSSKKNLYDNICLLLGEPTDGSLVINRIPDIGAVTDIDLQSDINKAIGNNYDLISDRTGLESNSTASTNRKLLVEEAGEESVKVNVRKLYDSLKSAEEKRVRLAQNYETALQQQKTYDLQYSVGYLSDVQYIQTKLALIQAESNKIGADLNYRLAYETYEWAIAGII